MKHIKNIIALLFVLLTFINCGYNEPLVEVLDINREFSPINLTARVRNQTTVELNWNSNEEDYINYYVVEFSADDANFGAISETVNVNSEELPVQVRLEGETVYYIRVKAVSNRNIEDSKWSTTEVTTLTEQIMLASEAGDIEALQATLRWEAGLNVTHFMLQPGNIRHDITSEEKTNGVAAITGLTSETEYTATLYNNTKIRGTAEFTTGIDVGDNTLVTVNDDLFQMIADAEDGDILLLEQGDYTAQTGDITLDKSITIQGLRADFKPQLKVSFSIVAGAEDVNLIDLDLTGDVAGGLLDVVKYSDVGNYNSLLINGCVIHDYDRSFLTGNITDAIVQSIEVENCIITNIMSNSGDFIDFRNSDVFNMSITKSTFNNCAPGRDFFRIDDAGTSTQSGNVCNVTLDSCTLYGCANNSSRRLMYVRFQANKITVTNTLIAETVSEGYSDQSRTDPAPTFSDNNYFNAPGFYDPAQVVFDGTTSYTTLDPGFANVASGNFTITNQTLLDNAVGDPRWRQ
ncbi:MAG: DUF5123 domain-containing protein [Flavobacteriaceae bacterium]